MPLTGTQIVNLAEQLGQEWNLPTLEMFASALNVKLDSLAPSGNVKQRALALINHINGGLPPRDGELLEALRLKGNAKLKAVAAELLKPAFFSPTGDAHDAITLGRTAFVDRSNLRQVVRDFTLSSAYTTHVLIVRGDQPCGKSYSWEYLRHLAVTTAGAIPMRLRLKDTRFTPRQIFEQVGLLLRLDRSGMPAMTDEPQLARIDALITWFKGQVVMLPQPYWLVIDDLNDPSVTPAMRETAYALAYAVEEIKPQNLWVALLGYNAPITDSDLRYIAQEDAKFPDASAVAEHFESIAKAGPLPLAHDVACQIADLVFAKVAKLDKESMVKITQSIERIGEKLLLGQQP